MVEIQNYFPYGANFNIPGFGDSWVLLLGIHICVPRWGLLALSFLRKLYQSPTENIA